MTKFLTRKSDKQVFPVGKKVARDSGSPSYVGVDKSQIEIPYKSGDIVYYKDDVKKEPFVVYQTYGNKKVSLGLREYPDTEQDYQTDISKIKKFKDKNLIVAQRKINKLLGKKINNPKPTSTLGRLQELQHIIKQGKKSEKELKKLEQQKDSDKDGVADSKDCEPYNPNKQGKLHDIAVRLLKQREQKLENERLEALKRLEETKETLRQQQAIKSEKNAKLQQKQAIINEIDAEKKKIQELKDANKKAKKEIFDASPTGKAVKLSSSAIKKTQKFLNKPKTKKVIKKLFG